MNGQLYWLNAKGGLDPDELIRTQHRLQDQVVRELLRKAETLSAAIATFKAESFGEIDAFNDVLAERYGGAAGGEKGNLTLMTYDGLVRIQVAVSDQQTFGPELQVAKQLVVECVKKWSDGAKAELRKLALDAFDADREGKVNRSRIYGLLRLEIADPTWQSAMQAIRDSISVMGSKRYIRISRRATPKSPWILISLDAATA